LKKAINRKLYFLLIFLPTVAKSLCSYKKLYYRGGGIVRPSTAIGKISKPRPAAAIFLVLASLFLLLPNPSFGFSEKSDSGFLAGLNGGLDQDESFLNKARVGT
jgi:hypothetical protein